ncbi:MAG: 8-oxoguanine deaminase [Acidimicrobiia bacterium]|nr:8-oxoguanine deaminase [Acidimicrobiia bacterium]
MSTLLVRNATALVTMDDERREISDGALFARNGWIEAVGPTSELPDSADEVLDARHHVVLPGLVNTHHHLYQTLTRAVPAAQDAGLFDWLKTLYPIWARMTASDVFVSTQIGLAELALSGCTTAFDHLYLFPNDSRLDDEIEAAGTVGIRLHASRGSMSLGESSGGLPPDSVVESEQDILDDTRRLIETYHDPTEGSMIRIVVAPCSPFSVTTAGMRESADLARQYGVSLHTHLAETIDEHEFCLEKFGLPPLPYAESVGWAGPDVWFAHAVHIDRPGVEWMAATGTGAAHCPTSNMRLASGIAPVRSYLDAGVRLGLGVDGSASNDGSHLLAEARQAMLLSRLAASPTLEGGPLLSARTALEMATRGGAAVLGRNDIGALAPGKAADFMAIDLNRLDYAGALHDPVAAAVFCQPHNVDFLFVHGRRIVDEGQLTTLELEPVIERHNASAQRIVGR